MADQSPLMPPEMRRLAWVGFGLVAAMLACLVAALVQVARLFFPAWQGQYLVVFCFLVALEAIISQHKLGRWRFPEREWFMFRLTELVVLLLALKATVYARRGLESLAADLAIWPRYFLETFFDPEYSFDMLVVLMVWLQSAWFAQNLRALEVPESADLYRADRKEDIRSGLMASRTEASEQLLSQFLTIGLLLTLLTALLQSRAVTSWLDLPVFRGGMTAVILFFVLGFVLLSVVQFSNLQLRWNFDGIMVSSDIARRWLGYSFGFLLGLMILISLLPTGYSIGLLTLLKEVLAIAAAVVSLLFSLLLTLVFLPVWWLINWLAQLLISGEALPPFKPPAFELPPSASASPVPWWEMLKSLLFWGIFLAVLVYSFSYYLSLHQETWAALRQLPLFRLLSQFWAWWQKHWRATRDNALQLSKRGWQRFTRWWLGPEERVARSWLRLKDLSARQRVIFAFLSLVRRGEEAGLPRRPSQTAGEYAQEVQCLLVGEQEVGAALTGLTTDFIEARYSAHHIAESQAHHAQGLWRQIDRAFRRRRKVSSQYLSDSGREERLREGY